MKLNKLQVAVLTEHVYAHLFSYEHIVRNLIK